MILILSEEKEPNAEEVILRLNEKKQDYFRINGEGIPLNYTITLDSDENDFIIEDLANLNTTPKIKLKQITSVWNRRRGIFQPSNDLLENEQDFIRGECDSVYESLALFTNGARWMNDIWKQKYALNQIVQLVTAQRVGLEVPKWLITQDSEKIKQYSSQNSLITKVINKGPLTRFGLNMIFTSEFLFDEIEDISCIKNSPNLFQQKVERIIELRITYIGGKVFSAASDIEEVDREFVDIRGNGLETIEYSPYRLPDAIEDKIIKFMKALSLEFGTIDMIITPKGDYVFIELNPGGQWGWIETQTGIPLYDELVNWLCGK